MSDASLASTLSNPKCPQTEIPPLSTKELDQNLQTTRIMCSAKLVDNLTNDDKKILVCNKNTNLG